MAEREIKIKWVIILATAVLATALFTVRYWIPKNDALQTNVSLVILTLTAGLLGASIYYKERRKEKVNYKVLFIGAILFVLIVTIIWVNVIGKSKLPF